jgi:hypothetical protein
VEVVVLFWERRSTKGIAIEDGIKKRQRTNHNTFFLAKYKIRNCKTSSKEFGLRAKWSYIMQKTPHAVSETEKIRTQTFARSAYIVLQEISYLSLQLNEEGKGRKQRSEKGHKEIKKKDKERVVRSK